MKRLLAGAGLAAAVIGGAHVAGAEAEPTPNRCAPIIDQTLGPRDSSSLLRKEIDNLASGGVATYIRIYKNGRPEGITSPEDAETVTSELAADCEDIDPDQIIVVVSNQPAAYDVFTTGQAATDISGGTIDNATQDFKTRLRATKDAQDSGETHSAPSYQQDVAELLQDINPYDQPDTTGQGGPGSGDTPKTPKEPFHLPKLPYESIGIGVLAVGALGAGGARIKRASTLHKLHTDYLDQAGDALSRAMTASLEADGVLGIIPDGDALDTRAIRSSIDETLTQLVTDKTALNDAYTAQRTRLWPNADAVRNAAASISDTASIATNGAARLEQATAELTERVGKIDETITNFGALIDSLEQAVAALESGGWDVSVLREQLQQYNQSRAQIIELRQKNYVDRPTELADQLDDSIIHDTEAANQLPTRLTAIGEAHISLGQTIEQKRTDVTVANSALEHIKAAYDDSCSSDISAYNERLAELIKALGERHAEVNGLVGKKSAESVQTAEEKQANMGELITRVDQLAHDIHERAEHLATLATELPNRFVQLAKASHDGIATAREFGDDTEPETHQALKDLQDAIAQTQRSLGADKPKLLELEAAAKKLKNQQQSLNEQARAEAEEMAELRHTVSTLDDRTNEAYQDLERYINSHSDVDSSTERAVVSISLIPGDTSAGRADLRAQAQELGNILREIERVKQAAKNDVKDAEAARAAEQLREQRQRDERRRQSSNYSGSSGGGSNHHSGSSSGGHGKHHSGGF